MLAPASSSRIRPRYLAVAVALAALLASGCASSSGALRPTPTGLVLREATGGRYDLSALRGKVVLVNFFATWCFPCMVEMPTFRALQEEQGARGLQVVAIGMDLEGAKVLEPYARVSALPFPILVASEAVQEGQTSFGKIVDLPTSFVFDREGELAAVWHGPVNPKALSEFVAKLLK